jgi:hypothetical protein
MRESRSRMSGNRARSELLALEPVAWFASGVCDRHYFDATWQLAKEDDVWKPLSDSFPESAISIPEWEFGWRCPYATNDSMNAVDKLLTKSVSVRLVPFCRRLEFRAGGRREGRRLHFERKRARVSVLTCSQGIVFAVPASSSCTLRSSSAAHAADHFGSSGPSTLSRSSVASASRSSTGSCSARCKSSDGFAWATEQA